MSSIGKGMIASSISAVLQSQGYTIRVRKMEPYLNVDAGTLNPNQHGEVFVTSDGTETDLDIGSYERFTGIVLDKTDVITTGQVYEQLLNKERRGDFLGETVQVIPHVTDLIEKYITNHNKNEDFIIYELGGTVGDLESLHFLQSMSSLQYKHQCVFIHVVWIPKIEQINEFKTKPAQHSIKDLREMGINPNIVVCRSPDLIDEAAISKLRKTTNIEHIHDIHNTNNIYNLPFKCKKIVFDIHKICKTKNSYADLKKLEIVVKKYDNRKDPIIKIGLISKYNDNLDAYKSIIEAINHASIEIERKVEIIHVHSKNKVDIELLNGIIVPGGFGHRETENMINYIQAARIKNIPFLGICFGMHLAVIEFCRNVINIKNASSEEFNIENSENVIQKYSHSETMGGTMRLGNIKCVIKENTRLHKIYNKNEIFERHRHRYDVSKNIQGQLEKNGMCISSKSNNIVEAIEISNHKWFIAVQYHAEMQSRPIFPSPLFVDFLVHSS